MSPEMQTTLISVICSGAIGIITLILGIVIGRQIKIFDEKRRYIVQTGVTTTEIINPNAFGKISMTVDKSLISGLGTEEEEPKVRSAYNHVVHASNTGLSDIEKPEIDILLDYTALIIDVKVDAGGFIPNDKVEIQGTKKRNFRRVILPYINKKQSLTISVLSINDTKAGCAVTVSGKGINHQLGVSSTYTVDSLTRELNITAIVAVAAIFIFSIAGFIGGVVTAVIVLYPIIKPFISNIP